MVCSLFSWFDFWQNCVNHLNYHYNFKFLTHNLFYCKSPPTQYQRTWVVHLAYFFQCRSVANCLLCLALQLFSVVFSLQTSLRTSSSRVHLIVTLNEPDLIIMICCEFMSKNNIIIIYFILSYFITISTLNMIYILYIYRKFSNKMDDS